MKGKPSGQLSRIYTHPIGMAGLALFACLMIASGCELPFEKELSTRAFVIRTGEHYSTPRLTETFTKEKLTFRATFDESAVYDLADDSMQENKNKLMGFSDCSSPHHENSARFAWQWNNDQLEIFAYCYVDSVRIEEFVGTVALNEENHYEIARTDAEYVFYLNGEKKAAVARATACDGGLNYMLYPYFGGSVPAPHEVRIEIEML